MPPAGAGESLGKKDLQLFTSITFPILLFFLILAFDRQSLSFASFLCMAVTIPVCQSLFFTGAMEQLPSILAHKHLKRLFLVALALSCTSTVYFTRIAHPSFLWEIGLYLSFVAWGAFVDAVLELSPFLSFIFSMQTITFVLLHSG